ncbi:MAG: DUF6318 family protein [Nocardioidaceae bacterium]|nr:DUF6318 family protein [Nocardioidaceae bacterium]
MTTTALACLLLVGCTDDPVGPVDGDVTTPTATVSPPPTAPTPPPLPEAAKEETTEGAIAFVEHYIDLLNYAANTGDVALLQSASRDCDGCTKYIDNYKETYQRGGYFEDPGWSLVAPFADREGLDVVVVSEVTAPAVTYVPSPGAQPTRGSNQTYSLRFVLSEGSESWVVTSFSGES